MSDADANRPSTLPLGILVAPWVPIVVATAWWGFAQAGLVAPVSWRLLAAFALFATLPSALIVHGLARASRVRTGDVDARIEAALRAVEDAQRLSARALAALEPTAPQNPDAHPAGASATPSAARNPGRVARRARWLALVAILLFAGGVAAAYAVVPEPPRAVHDHATLHVVVDGERMRFLDASFDLSERGFMRGHLHIPEDDLVHVEGAPGLSLGEFMARTLGIHWRGDGTLELEQGLHGARAPLRSQNDAAALYVASEGEPWRRESAGPTYVPRNGDRMLVAHGVTDDAALAGFQEAIREPPRGP